MLLKNTLTEIDILMSVIYFITDNKNEKYIEFFFLKIEKKIECSAKIFSVDDFEKPKTNNFLSTFILHVKRYFTRILHK